MRQRTVNYFIGSLFSRQVILAYGIAGGITTGFQVLLVSLNVFSLSSLKTRSLPWIIELYVETLMPLWIPPVTRWNLLMILMNIVLSVLVVAWWSIKYSRSF